MSFNKTGPACSFILVTLAVASFAAAQSRFDARPGGFDTAINTRTIDSRTLDPQLLVNAASLEPRLQVNSLSGKVNTCQAKINIFGHADLTYYGTWKYTWTLYRDGQQVGTPSSQTITCSPKDPVCEPPSVVMVAPSVSGKYQLKVQAGPTQALSNAVEVVYAPPCAPKEKGNLLHVTGLTSDGRLWHSIRYATEYTWQPLQDVWLAALDRWSHSTTIVDVSVATIGNELHVAVVDGNGKIFHAIRYPYRWQPFREVNVAGTPGTFSRVAVAEVNNELHVAAISTDGGLWHTIRHANSWDKFGNVLTWVLRPNTTVNLKELDVAEVRGELHMVLLDTRGYSYHTIRRTSSWDKLGDMQAAAVAPGYFKSISAAEVAGELHVAGVAMKDGRIWHTIRHATYWDKFGDVQQLTGTPGTFERVAVGQSGNELHMIAVTTQGGLYHTIRHTSSWDKFGNVEEAAAGERGTFRLVSADGVYLP